MTKKQSIQLFEEKKRDPELSKGWGQIGTPPPSVQMIRRRLGDERSKKEER